ncbi:MAG TPA: citrate synthase, partial [Stellaceae bacterium]|nr:citrate synthase [Stellaceae bacterium]
APMADVTGGLEGVVAAETVLSHVDGERGSLIIRGLPLEILAPRGFEPAVALLWDGFIDAKSDARELAERLGVARRHAFDQLGYWLPAARDRTLPEGVRLSLAALRDTAGALDIAAALPVALAAILRARQGLTPVAPDPRRRTAADFLQMMRGAPASEGEAAALNTYLAAVVDHGLNASTFTARVVASTRASLAAAIGAAFSALTGPLHGGAPGPVLDMLDAIDTPERIDPWLEDALARGERLMGFGHRVYRVRDPRADALKAALQRLGPASGRLAFAELVERRALALLRRRKPSRAIDTNVEFYTALLLDALGVPRDAMVSVFAMSRVAGWIAHALEQQRTGRLIRPASRYVGPEPADAV